MNEAQIRERLQEAVGDWRYPAGLSSRVEARLNRPTLEHDLRSSSGPRHSPWLMSLGRAGSVAGVLLVVLVMATLVLGVHMWIVSTRHVTPVTPNTSVKQYQAMISADLQAMQDVPVPPLIAPLYTCTSLEDANCLPETALFTAAMQHWLDDLDRSQPPARFATMDELMRRYLAIAISEQRAFVAAYKAKDPNWVNMPYNDGTALTFARDVIASSQGTTLQYKAEVRLDRTYLLACALCQRLVTQSQMSCPTGQTPSCGDEIAAVRLQVEVFLEDLVRLYAPDDMTSADANLQTHLVTADQQLDAMVAALSAGDQVALQSSHDGLRQALNRVESDAAAIAGSS